jgi:heme/copper-type cytochrome/quinol oxidase subunit 1
MDPFVRHFIRASLLWLGVGVVLGVLMALRPAAVVYRPAHMHANLLGFVSMMIFGVAYHVLPRFTGRPLHSPKLAGVHVWLANVGLALLVTGWLLRPHAVGVGLVIAAGAITAAAGAFTFIYNIWRTLDAGQTPAPVAVLRMHRNKGA